jgi:hypothetical protein
MALCAARLIDDMVQLINRTATPQLDISNGKKMKLRATIALLGCVVTQTASLGDTADAPYPWVTTSRGGDFLFKMVPPTWKFEGFRQVIDREPFGVAYEITEDGTFEEVWRTQGWYTFVGYLSANGRYFVRLGPWASDQKNHTDLAIAFYEQGKLIKEYQVRELITKPDLVEDSVSHYVWRPEIQTRPNGFRGRAFHLVMIDKTAYAFNYKTGEIISRGRDEGAKSEREIWEEEQAAANKKGQELFDTSTFKDAYSRVFEITEIEAMDGTILGSSVKGPAWIATFTPKQKFDHKASVEPVFPIRDDNQIDVSLTPEQIISAFEKAFRHPFIENRFKEGGATGLRLRIQGDRLHWSTAEVAMFLEQIMGNTPKEDGLAHWALFIIDAKEPRYDSIYVNIKTGEIIDEDKSKWPRKPFLIDAAGTRTNANKSPDADSTSGSSRTLDEE